MKREMMRSTVRITKALSDIQRLRILMLLRAGELCVCQIIAVLGLAPSTVSKHLSLLSEADLVLFRKEGRWAYYRLPKGSDAPATVPVVKWVQAALVSDAQVRRDAEALKRALACSPTLLVTRQRQAKAAKKKAGMS